MACDVPVISSSVGGFPNYRSTGTGYIAEIGDIDRMAKYAVDLLTNDLKRRQFGRAGRTRAVENFDVRRSSQCTRSTTQECLGADRPLPRGRKG